MLSRLFKTSRVIAQLWSEDVILVYQMGKVGSRSIHESIAAQYAAPILHMHRLSPQNIQHVREEHLAAGRTPIDESMHLWIHRCLHWRGHRRLRIVTAVREPIARNVSAYFQNHDHFDICAQEGDPPIEKLTARFLEDYPHDVPLTWFDRELKSVFGIDVFEYSFPKDKGVLKLHKGAVEVLVLKCEIDDDAKSQAIGDFLEIPHFHLQRKNVGAAKAYADTYKRFIEGVRLPVSYIDRMCESRLTRHFYSDAEIATIRHTWMQ